MEELGRKSVEEFRRSEKIPIIVVLENIYVKIEEGESPHEAVTQYLALAISLALYGRSSHLMKLISSVLIS
jgi:hypothetical protein